MWKAWPLVAAAAFGVIAGASLASAQTVIARNVPAGSTMELVLNETKVGTASPDPIRGCQDSIQGSGFKR